MNLSKFFIDRPIFAGVISVVIFLAGLIAMTQLAHLGISRGGAAFGRGDGAVSRRQSPDHRRDGGDARWRSRSTAPRACSTWAPRLPATAPSP